ncbi:MAG TPA: DeoR/GlpR family DNA-binding transcription regulator [Tepidisphaeraceae bacterium]|nr:DeoR/GlpR family DNA-binding transcription regulator [Tepidisphaeraceae bacterium]
MSSSAKPVTKAFRDEQAARRREKIEEAVREKESVSFKELQEMLGVELKEQTLYKDGNYFASKGIPIIVRDKTFRPGPDRLTTIGRRRIAHTEEKEAVGRIAADVVLSPRDFPGGPRNPDVTLMSQMYLPGARITAELDAKLLAYWLQPHRTLVIDAGSTNAAISRQIELVAIPSSTRHITMLRIVSNGLSIARMFSDSDRNRQYELLPLGGTWDYDTDAMTGLLAERCWEAFALRPDIAVIGTTAIDPMRGACCDTPEEAQIKTRMLSSARIKCIAADSSKLLNPSGGVSVFASFSSEAIDCIITDWKINSDEKAALRFREQAKSLGISIIAGSDWQAATPPQHAASRGV